MNFANSVKSEAVTSLLKIRFGLVVEREHT